MFPQSDPIIMIMMGGWIDGLIEFLIDGLILGSMAHGAYDLWFHGSMVYDL